MHRSERGSTLLEMMISVLIGVTFMLAFLSVSRQFQVWASNLNLLLEREDNFWLTPLLLSRWIPPAGNQRWNQEWNGIEAGAGELEINADIDGSEGFPDSELNSSFEAIRLRHSNGNLQLKSGAGSFQPVIKNISGFEPLQAGPSLLQLTVSAVTDRAFLASDHVPLEQEVLIFHLRNYRPNLFAEAP